MAKKLKLMSLFQELQGRAQVTDRRPTTASTGVYLMQLRAQSGATTLPRRRFMISVDLQSSPAAPHPVKINHVRSLEMSESPSTGESVRVTTTASGLSHLPQVRPEPG